MKKLLVLAILLVAEAVAIDSIAHRWLDPTPRDWAWAARRSASVDPDNCFPDIDSLATVAGACFHAEKKLYVCTSDSLFNDSVQVIVTIGFGKLIYFQKHDLKEDSGCHDTKDSRFQVCFDPNGNDKLIHVSIQFNGSVLNEAALPFWNSTQASS
ncbi:hypothetical protein QR680_008320 [Steinernema hermaphroditum]|uniref:Uncharacterized protein n=1 Tax=Steinernema hermaphroditum TaxID=289476 RepID=A0AA39M7N3_9BILA|nr:hypothetical protein QR680_008320 [Steinernema hermaphroditum]